MRYTNDVITGSRLTLSGAGVEPLRVSASRLISRPAPPTASGLAGAHSCCGASTPRAAALGTYDASLVTSSTSRRRRRYVNERPFATTAAPENTSQRKA